MARGRMRIYLGASPGVGKTYAMLDEGRSRSDRGADVVVGFVETHGRAATAAQIGDLEVIPRREMTYRDRAFTEMDVDAILARSPDVALIDELAHTNVPGSRNDKRWQDVQQVLDTGIDVISTVNIQHLESINDVVEQITGVAQKETIPDEVVRSAEQVELVDMTPEAIQRRMAQGLIYAPERVDAALANYFRAGNLGALRELALLWVADRVDEALTRYRDEQGIARQWETRERVVVSLTASPSSEPLIRRAARMAERARGDLLGVHVRRSDGRSDESDELLEHHRQLLQDLGGEYHELVAVDVVDALVDFARNENATQLVLGTSKRSRWAELARGSVINQLIRRSGDIDVHVISTRDQPREIPSHQWRHHRLRPTLPRRRRIAGWAVALAGTVLLTALFTTTRDTFGQGSHFLLYQGLVVVAAAVGGAAPAVTAAALGSAALNWFFTPPFHTWTVDNPENVLALVVFVIVGILVGLLVTTLARRTADARKGRAEAEALARMAGGLIAADDPLPLMLDRILGTLALDGIAIQHKTSGETVIAAGAEPDAPTAVSIELPDDLVVVVNGALTTDDRRILEAFAAQLAAVVERRRLRKEADSAAALAEADRLRTALLRAVSHDLRTPLASIKASVTGLLQDDVTFSPADQHDFLLTIDEEADRLDSVVANLLDASRLEAGTITPTTTGVALDDIVPAALASISGLAVPVKIDVAPSLPLALADAGLLERAIANLVTNAARAAPPGTAVTIAGSRRARHLELRIVDHGPGVAPEQRPAMFEPFMRLGDSAHHPGVGLGLAVAKGTIEAMGGTLSLEDTPGGGLTMVITLRADDGD